MGRDANAPAVRYDAIIVGGGPSGLSAALLLGRCRRRVVVFDSGRYRNAASLAVHCYLTRDGVAPAELLRLGREELAPYDVEIRRACVTDARVLGPDAFEVTLEDGSRARGARLILATGVVDHLPEVDGVEALFGTSVHHCPYCDGWEHRDGALAAYGRGHSGCELALSLQTWSHDVVLVTDGPTRLRPADAARLADHGVRVIRSRIARVEGREGRLERIVFSRGEPLPREAMFFTTGQRQRSRLPDALGCRRAANGAVLTNRHEETSVPGVHVIGDASRDPQLAIIAAAEGARAAMAVNQALQRRDAARAVRTPGLEAAARAAHAGESAGFRLDPPAPHA